MDCGGKNLHNWKINKHNYVRNSNKNVENANGSCPNYSPTRCILFTGNRLIMSRF